MLEKGSVVAGKESGFHLACNPFMEEPLRKLRSGKDGRETVLANVSDLEALKEYGLSMKRKKTAFISGEPYRASETVPEDASRVNSGLNTIGAMLPYMPFHMSLRDLTSRHWS